VSAARDEVLGRVRAAIAGAELQPVERAYRRSLGLDLGAVVDRFCERVADYRATVHRVREAEVAALVAAIASGPLLVPDGVPETWLPETATVVRDARPVSDTSQRHSAREQGISSSHEETRVSDTSRRPTLTPQELDEAGGVLTGCTLAIAETGTIVLSSAPAEGRRALTLVPDLHVCVVRAAQIVDSVPAAFDALGPLVRDERRPLTFVSGPSATSDIELDRVEGVHGPRTLIVIVVDGQEEQ
jgi:L-lactate dehydrogenase complex protein LldG